MQTWASIEHGLWYARSAEFLQQPVMELLRWLRTIGDTVFLIGTGALAYFVIGLITGWSYVTSQAGKRCGMIRRCGPAARQWAAAGFPGYSRKITRQGEIP